MICVFALAPRRLHILFSTIPTRTFYISSSELIRARTHTHTRFVTFIDDADNFSIVLPLAKSITFFLFYKFTRRLKCMCVPLEFHALFTLNGTFASLIQLLLFHRVQRESSTGHNDNSVYVQGAPRMVCASVTVIHYYYHTTPRAALAKLQFVLITQFTKE